MSPNNNSNGLSQTLLLTSFVYVPKSCLILCKKASICPATLRRLKLEDDTHHTIRDKNILLGSFITITVFHTAFYRIWNSCQLPVLQIYLIVCAAQLKGTFIQLSSVYGTLKTMKYFSEKHFLQNLIQIREEEGKEKTWSGSLCVLHRTHLICDFHVFCKSLIEPHCFDFSLSINILYNVWTHRAWLAVSYLARKFLHVYFEII